MYLQNGGANAFRDETKKVTVKVGLIEIKVSGTNLVPIIDALRHYEGVMGFGAEEREKALCSIISRCRKWRQIKGAKAQAAADPNATVRTRFSRVTALMAEALAALNASNTDVNTAFGAYLDRKDRGPLQTGTLARGYVNERTAYIASGKKRSVSGSLIDELVDAPTAKLRTGDKLGGAAAGKIQKKFGGRDFDALTVKEWQAIDKIATELDGHRLETKYLTRRERLNYMLESDWNGGLQYIVGLRPVATGAGVWPYAMDEWGNIYTANDRVDQTKQGYAMFNHSSFTAGDTVVCAGMLQVDAARKLRFIDTNSGHYKPTREQLAAVIKVLRDEYHVNFSQTEVSTAEPRVVWAPGAASLQRFLDGQDPL